jgi:hypothetical protein
MGTRTDHDHDHHADEACLTKASGPPPAGGAVYGLGLIGALVWFWRQADTPEEHAMGVLKAMVWPAILVYEAFRILDR